MDFCNYFPSRGRLSPNRCRDQNMNVALASVARPAVAAPLFVQNPHEKEEQL
jgi:hypothetical protein